MQERGINPNNDNIVAFSKQQDIEKNFGKAENDDKVEDATDVYVAKLKSDFIADIVHDGHSAKDV